MTAPALVETNSAVLGDCQDKLQFFVGKVRSEMAKQKNRKKIKIKGEFIWQIDLGSI